jgi:hypothetical protein
MARSLCPLELVDEPAFNLAQLRLDRRIEHTALEFEDDSSWRLGRVGDDLHRRTRPAIVYGAAEHLLVSWGNADAADFLRLQFRQGRMDQCFQGGPIDGEFAMEDAARDFDREPDDIGFGLVDHAAPGARQLGNRSGQPCEAFFHPARGRFMRGGFAIPKAVFAGLSESRRHFRRELRELSITGNEVSAGVCRGTGRAGAHRRSGSARAISPARGLDIGGRKVEDSSGHQV